MAGSPSGGMHSPVEPAACFVLTATAGSSLRACVASPTRGVDRSWMLTLLATNVELVPWWVLGTGESVRCKRKSPSAESLGLNQN